MRMMTIILLVFCINLSFGQKEKLAYIRDPDGFTNVREGKSNSANIVGKINEGEFFFAEKSHEEWVKVRMESPNDFKTPVFMHRSRIQFIDELPLKEQKKLFSEVFKEIKNERSVTNQLYSKYNHKTKKWNSNEDSVKYYNYCHTRKEPQPMFVYYYILELFSNYYSKTGDKELYKLFAETVYEDQGNAMEAISWNAGKCFMSRPEQTLHLINGFPKEISELIKQKTLTGIFYQIYPYGYKEKMFIYAWLENYIYSTNTEN